MYNQDETLTAAFAYGLEKYPNARSQRHAAFANSVMYLVTGNSGGFGGPSVREHLCSILLGTKIRAGNWDYYEAIEACEPIVYGPLPEGAQQVAMTENCFDDDPDDIDILYF